MDVLRRAQAPMTAREIVEKVQRHGFHRDGSLDHEQAETRNVLRNVLSGVYCGNGTERGSVGGNIGGTGCSGPFRENCFGQSSLA
jgi:hypothetical protein